VAGLGFADGNECCCAGGQQGLAVELDEHIVFDGRESCYNGCGLAEQEFFADGGGLEIFVAWAGVYGIVLLVG
jgi:hypothetical protein